MNIKLAVETISSLRNLGITEFCICPGARNAPLLAALSQFEELRGFYFFDERMAAFFALGRIKSTNKPTGVITTSGTAVGELLPAVMEAYYAGLPIVLLTADRPRNYRGTGAPQAAEHVNIFGSYAGLCVDLAAGETVDLTLWDCRSPLHINTCFDEPLLDTQVSNVPAPEISRVPGRIDLPGYSGLEVEALNSFLKNAKYLLVILGSLKPDEATAVARFLKHLKTPIYVEALSGLREDQQLAPFRLKVGDVMLKLLRNNGWPVDAILRIGGIPTHRLWRDLEQCECHLSVYSVSANPFPGLTRSQMTTAPLDQFFESYSLPDSYQASTVEKLVRADTEAHGQLVSLLEKEPKSEPGIFYRLSKRIPKESHIFLGNSLPIREWDLAASFENRDFQVNANRGLNGIDGQISSFLGYCQKAARNWGIFGDLTTLYDATAPWIMKQMPDVCAQIVIINNGGGKIFHRMFPNWPEFLNSHDLTFAPLAELWRLRYELWTEIPDQLESYGQQSHLIEVVPDECATTRFWEEFGRLG